MAAAAEPVAGGVGSSTSSADSVTVSAPTPGAAGTTSTTQSVTVSGTGGLTGLIQSALNQVFNAPWSSQPNPGKTEYIQVTIYELEIFDVLLPRKLVIDR